MLREEDVKDFYKCLSQREDREDGHAEEGITLDSTFLSDIDIYLIVLKKLREEDVEEQLTEAFRIVDEKGQGFLESDEFKEYLMVTGYKWGEDQADEFMKEFETKDKKVIFNDAVKKLIKR